MTFPAKGSGSLCLRKRFWDRHGANITTRQKVVYLDVETTLRHTLPPNKLQRLSRGDPKNLGANTRIRILSRERSSRDLPGKRIGLTKRKNIIRRSKEQGQAFPLHQNFLLEISVVRPVSQISHTATSLFAHFHEDSYFSLFWDMRQIHFYCEVQFEMSKKNAYKDRGRKSVEKPQHSAGEFRIITPFMIQF